MTDTLLQLQHTEVSRTPPNRSRLLKKQMPGLDVLRGVAVLAVVFYHGLRWHLPPHAGLTASAVRICSVVASGWLGVNLFFVLSGFLITGILVDTRERPNYWRSFYVRRALRILPLYLLVLVLIRLQLHVLPKYLLMCLFYVANMTAFFNYTGPNYGPLWSLAVEEQFYLLWPFFVRRFPVRFVAVLCAGLIVVTPLLRWLASGRYPWIGDSADAWLYSDNLAWGALLAVLLRLFPAASSRAIKAATLSLAAIAVGSGGLLARLHLLNRTTPLGASLQAVPFLAFFSMLLLLALRYGDRPGILRWSAPLRFFGYISYGLYLLHTILFHAFDDTVGKYLHSASDILTADYLLARFAMVLALSSAVCLLSRRFFEERFLRLKGRLAP